MTPISFPIAKLLKEKGFEQNPMKYINQATINGTLVFPTIADVIMWLYKNHGIWCYPFRVKNYGEVKWYYTIETTEDILLYSPVLTFNSPTEAYEAAIKYCLTKLI